MTPALPDPAPPAPSRDSAAYARRSILSPAFWAMIALSMMCILAGMTIAGLAPRFLPARIEPAPTIAPTPGAPSTPARVEGNRSR